MRFSCRILCWTLQALSICLRINLLFLYYELLLLCNSLALCNTLSPAELKQYIRVWRLRIVTGHRIIVPVFPPATCAACLNNSFYITEEFSLDVLTGPIYYWKGLKSNSGLPKKELTDHTDRSIDRRSEYKHTKLYSEYRTLAASIGPCQPLIAVMIPTLESGIKKIRNRKTTVQTDCTKPISNC